MTSRPVQWIRKYFYFFMSLVIAAVVVFGFSQTIDQDLFHASPLPPLVLDFHAAVFSGWVVFLMLQSLLVRTHKVRVHRTLGWFGVALAVTMVVLGTYTATGMDRFHAQNDSKNAAFGAAFLIVQWAYVYAFGIMVALAIYWRRSPEFHRRLMLMGTCVLTDAAWGRFPEHFLAFNVYGAIGADVLILMGVVRDLIVDRRVHKAYLYGLPAWLVCQVIAEYTYMHASPWWMHIANAILY
ncbi:MAG: hypothetical protein WB439_14075 [Acidobacteriaceae bacterium]